MKGPFLSLWRWETQGSTRSFIAAGSLVGEWIPSGSCPHLQRYSRKPSTCSRDRLCHSSSAAWKLGQMERAYSQKRLWFVFTIQACSGSAQMKDELCGKQNQQTAWQGVLVRKMCCLCFVFVFPCFCLLVCFTFLYQLHRIVSTIMKTFCKFTFDWKGWLKEPERKTLFLVIQLWPSEIIITFSQISVNRQKPRISRTKNANR